LIKLLNVIVVIVLKIGGLAYKWDWMEIEEAIERMEEYGYIDINDFEL
jgi:hypothetical protein